MGGSGALTGGSLNAEVPTGGVSVMGASAVCATGRAGAALYFIFCRCRLAGRLMPDLVAVALPFLDFALVDLAVEDLAELFVLVAKASEVTSEKAANEARKSRRFKYFFRQRQPVAETKGPCHLTDTAPLINCENYNTSAAWSARRERSPRCNVM